MTLLDDINNLIPDRGSNATGTKATAVRQALALLVANDQSIEAEAEAAQSTANAANTAAATAQSTANAANTAAATAQSTANAASTAAATAQSTANAANTAAATAQSTANAANTAAATAQTAANAAQSTANAANTAAATAQSTINAQVNSALNRPSIRPSLLLDLTSEVVDPRITYVRNDSAKSYFDRSGTMRIAGPNEWPLEWNPSTGECLGRSVWEARTNFYRDSGRPGAGAIWFRNNLSAEENAELGLDGNMSATRLTIVNNGPLTFFGQGVSSAIVGSTYIRWVVAKAGTINTLIFETFGAAYTTSTGLNRITQYNLSTGVISGHTENSSMIHIRDGWYLCARFDVASSTNIGGAFYVGVYGSSTNAGGFLYVNYAQFELGTFATPWIPTTSAPVTRNAEAPVINGVNFSNFYNINEGTLYVEAIRPSRLINDHRLATISDNSFLNIIDTRIQSASSLPTVDVRVNNVSVFVSAIGTAIAANQKIEMALAYQQDNFIGAANSVVVTDNTGTIPTGLTTLSIGHIVNLRQLNGNIQKVAYYPKRLSNTEIQQLTTTGLLAGTNPNQLPTLGDLGTAARFDLRALLAMPNRQELTIQGTGASQTVQIRRPYAFNFAIVDSTGSTVTTTPTPVCAANTDHALVFNTPVGRILTYSITPIIFA